MELEGTAWAIKSHFPAIAGNDVIKSISNSILKLIAYLAPNAPLRNLFQNNISPTVRNHLISSQKVFVPTHTSLVLCQYRLLSEAIFLLSWCSSACAFREQGHALQLPSRLAKYTQAPLRWGLQSEDVLGVLLSQFLFLEQRCESTGAEKPMSKQGACQHPVPSALEGSPAPPTSQAPPLAFAQLQLGQQRLCKGCPAHCVPHVALTGAWAPAWASEPGSWCRGGLSAANHELLSHVPITKILGQISALLSLCR